MEIIFLIIAITIFDGISCGRIIRIDEHDSDMKALHSEPEEELSRDDLVEILHNGQFFQDIISEHVAPLEYEFGHVCENPEEWEQRFERKDFGNKQFQGKVRWGDKNGNYGEQYWDLNH